MPDPNTLNPDDLTLDDLFNEEPPVVATQTQSTSTNTQEPQTPVPAEPYLRTSTGTIYKSSEDAVRGTEEKDRQIEQMRQTFIALHGYDPINGKPVRFTPYQQDEVNYARDPERLYDDLAKANGDGKTRPPDKRAYATVLQKLLHDTYGPVMTQSAKAVTISELEHKVPGIRDFIGSQKYQEYLRDGTDGRPNLLRQAIEASETQPGMQAQLEDLYRLAYEGANGRSLPEVLKSARAASQPNTSTSSQPRPTLQPTSQPLAQNSGEVLDLSTPEGRKAIMDQGKARGIDKQVMF